MAVASDRRVVSKRVLYVELDNNGVTRHLHYAPYLDYWLLADDEPAVDAFLERPECAWTGIWSRRRKRTPSPTSSRKHLAEVRAARLALIDKTEAAVKDRLTKEISYWDHRAAQLALEEWTGKTGARLNSGEARRRGGHLAAPAAEAAGGAEARRADIAATAGAGARHRDGDRARPRFEPTDRELDKLGYDIESRDPATGKLRFIEVKGTLERRRHGHRQEERDPVLR